MQAAVYWEASTDSSKTNVECTFENVYIAAQYFFFFKKYTNFSADFLENLPGGQARQMSIHV